ncbi:MAG: hypothetical protein QNJ00_00115 [Woeseiaceae bacterium]|nr:hypothetical protein [Woeseiaceae bacterium]
MKRKLLIAVLVLLLAPFAYFGATRLIAEYRYADAAAVCALSPSSECVAELAILRLPKVLRWDDFSMAGLRELGYDAIVDERLRERDKRDSRTGEFWRDVEPVYALLRDDIDTFNALPAQEPITLYLVANRLQRDYPDMAENMSRLEDTELVVLARRVSEYEAPQHVALIRRWRETLEAEDAPCRQWQLLIARAQAFGHVETARDILIQALPRCTASNLRFIKTMWRVAGTEATLAEIGELDLPEERLKVAVYLAEQAVTSSLLSDAQAFQAMVAASVPAVDATALEPYIERIARVLIALDNIEAARPYVLAFADQLLAREPHPHQSFMPLSKLPEPPRAELLASVGATERAISMTGEMLERMPEPRQYRKNSDWTGQDDAPPYISASRMYEAAGAVDQALAAADEAIVRSPPPGLSHHPLVWGVPKYSVRNYNTAVANAVALRCRLGQVDAAIALTGEVEDIAYRAREDCVVALRRENPGMSASAVTDALGLYSPRELELNHTKSLVEAGRYEEASRHIRAGLTSPPVRPPNSLAYSNQPKSLVRRNLLYLRLAIMIRDDDLVSDVAVQILDDSVNSREKDAWVVLVEVALIMRKWSEMHQGRSG